MMASTSLSVFATTGETPMEPDSNLIQVLENFIQQGGSRLLRNIVEAGFNDPVIREKIVEICKLFATYYDNRQNAKSNAQSEVYNDGPSRRFMDYPDLMNDFSEWRKARKELIDISKSTAERLDQQYYAVNTARMISAFVEILNSLNLGIRDYFCGIIDSYKPSKLGIIIKSGIQLAPYLRFTGFVVSFIDILETQWRVKRVLNFMRNDKDMLEPLEKWLQETKEHSDYVKRLLPYEINKEITKSIEEVLKDLGEEQKIFSVAILSNLLKDPMIVTDKDFLTKALQFCGTDAAKGYYKRLIADVCPSELDCNLLNVYDELRKSEREEAKLKSTLKDSKGVVEQVEENGKGIVARVGNSSNSKVGEDFRRVAICMISGLSIYCSYGNIRAGTKHRHSDRLRKLSRKAQSYLNIMQQIGLSHIENFKME